MCVAIVHISNTQVNPLLLYSPCNIKPTRPILKLLIITEQKLSPTDTSLYTNQQHCLPVVSFFFNTIFSGQEETVKLLVMSDSISGMDFLSFAPISVTWSRCSSLLRRNRPPFRSSQIGRILLPLTNKNHPALI